MKGRWKLRRRDRVEEIDPREAGRLLDDLLSEEDHATFVASLAGDEDLATT